MLVDRNIFEEWMQRIMVRIDRIEGMVANKQAKPCTTIDGEKLLDNQDLCFLLNCSKRTLQRFRGAGLLPCRRIRQKTYYLESDVVCFIREHLKPIPTEKEKS